MVCSSVFENAARALDSELCTLGCLSSRCMRFGGMDRSKMMCLGCTMVVCTIVPCTWLKNLQEMEAESRIYYTGRVITPTSRAYV